MNSFLEQLGAGAPDARHVQDTASWDASVASVKPVLDAEGQAWAPVVDTAGVADGSGAVFKPVASGASIWDEYTPEQLIDDPDFDPARVLAQDATLLKQPAVIDKLAAALRLQQERGLRVLPTASKAVAAAYHFLSPSNLMRIGKRVYDTGQAVSPEGILTNPVKAMTSFLEVAASVESAGLRTVDLVRKAVRGGMDASRRRVEAVQQLAGVEADSVLSDPTLWRNRLLMDAASLESLEAAEKGEGAWVTAMFNAGQGLGEAVAKGTLRDFEPLTFEQAGIKLDPEAVRDLSFLTDPLNLAFGVGGAVNVTTKAGRVVAQAATARTGKSFIDTISRVIGESAKVAGTATERLAFRLTDMKGTWTGLAASAGGIAAARGFKRLGRGFTGEQPFSGAVARITRAFLLPVRAVDAVATSAPVRAVAGGVAATMLPNPTRLATLALPTLVSGAATEGEAGGIIGTAGAFAVLGALAGAAPGVVRNSALGAVNRRFREVLRRPIEDFEYGRDADLDAAHRETIDNLRVSDPDAANKIVWVRAAAVPDGTELYVLPRAIFSERVASARGTPSSAAYEQAGYFYTTQGGKKVIYLGEDATALGHEVGHAVIASMPVKERAAFVMEMRKRYSPADIRQFGEFYDSLLRKGLESDPALEGALLKGNEDAILAEMGAEIMTKVIGSHPLDGLPPKATTRAIDWAARFSETLGAYQARFGTPPEAGGSPLGVAPSPNVARLGAQALDRGLARSPLPPSQLGGTAGGSGVPPHISPRGSGAETRGDAVREAGARGLRGAAPPLVPENAPRIPAAQVAPLGLQRVVPGAEEARAAIQSNPNRRFTATHAGVFRALNRAMDREQGDVRPVRIEYAAVRPTAEGTRRDPVLREREQAAAYVQEAMGAMPASLRASVEKVTVPYRWEVLPEGNVNLLAVSLEKIIANAVRVNDKARAGQASDLIPYEHDAAGRYTEGGWRSLVTDLVSFSRNHANGFAGDGSRIQRPSAYTGVLPPENISYSPNVIPRTRADFINLLLGVPPPRTSRTLARLGTRVPNIEAQELARANQRQVIAPAITSRAGQNVYRRHGNVPIAELNPLRDAFARRGVDLTDRNVFQAIEQLDLEHIAAVRSEANSPFRAVSTDAARAGFMPDVQRLEPNAGVRTVAEKYVQRAMPGKALYTGYEPLKPEFLMRVADAFEAASSAPDAPETRAAYGALSSELLEQWRSIADAGYTLEPWHKPGQPYKNSAELRADVADNKHLWFFPTEAGFGDAFGENRSMHPLLEDSGVVVGGTPLRLNDVFRAVHDFFGHAANGYQFGPRGEYNAFLSHARMFSDEAVPALAAETLAQNAWVNFGPAMRGVDGQLFTPKDPGYLGPTERPYADQKAIVLSPEIVQEALQSSFMPKVAAEPRIESARATRQLARKRALSDSVGGDLRLVRYSSRSPAGEESVADPRNMGRGNATPTDLRGLNKTFWFTEGSRTGADRDVVATVGKTMLGARVAGDAIYDTTRADPLDWLSTANRVHADQRVKDAGYAGLRVRGREGREVVVLFEPVIQRKLGRVERAPHTRAVVPKDAPSFMPRVIERELGQNADFARAAPDNELRLALRENVRGAFGKARELDEGTPVGVRIDVPAFLKTGHYVETIHTPAGHGRVGTVIGYDSAVRLLDPSFFVSSRAEKIHAGSAKFPVATVEGRYVKDRAVPSGIDTWVPVGFDPREHIFFYDKRTDAQVVGGDEAYAVGNTVFVRNPRYGDRTQAAFMPLGKNESVKSAAVRDATGTVYTGAAHGEAYEKAENAGVDLVEATLTPGFVTSAGRFVARATALDGGTRVPDAAEVVIRRR
jgi:hypothetical protein